MTDVGFISSNDYAPAPAPAHEMPCTWQQDTLFPLPPPKIDREKYMASAAWRRRRNHVLRRDDYRCQDCSSTLNPHVHHLTYRNLGREPHYELITVCGECHTLRHKGHWVPGREPGMGYDSLGTKTDWRRYRHRIPIAHTAQKLLIGYEPSDEMGESYFAEDIYGPFEDVLDN